MHLQNILISFNNTNQNFLFGDLTDIKTVNLHMLFLYNFGQLLPNELKNHIQIQTEIAIAPNKLSEISSQKLQQFRLNSSYLHRMLLRNRNLDVFELILFIDFWNSLLRLEYFFELVKEILSDPFYCLPFEQIFIQYQVKLIDLGSFQKVRNLEYGVK